MRKFYLETLNQLDKLTGLQQMSKLMQMKDSKKEINDLLDILCRVSNQFNYIPEADQQRIISENLLSDGEFIGFNAKIIFKWLSQAKGLYYKGVQDQEPPAADYKPLEGKEREKAIEAWLKSLQAFGEAVKPEYSGSKLKASLPDRPASTGYVPSTTIEDLNAHELHLQYVKENYDYLTGKPKENWISEDEFLKQQSIDTFNY